MSKQHSFSRKLHLIFYKDTVNRSIIYDLGHRYPGLCFNIHKANIGEGIGYVQITLSSSKEETIEAAIAWLLSEGVDVRDLEEKEGEFQQAA